MIWSPGASSTVLDLSDLDKENSMVGWFLNSMADARRRAPGCSGKMLRNFFLSEYPIVPCSPGNKGHESMQTDRIRIL